MRLIKFYRVQLVHLSPSSSPQRTRAARRARVCGGLSLAAAMTLAACSSGSGDAFGGQGASTKGSTPVVATQDATGPGKVVSPTVTAPAPTMVRVSDEDAAVEVFERFLDAVPVIADPPNPAHPLIGELTTGSLKQRIVESLTARRDSGRRSVGGYRWTVVSVQAERDVVAILSCSLDESVGVNPDGTPGVPGTQWFLRSARVERTDAGWRMAEWVKGDACDPDL